MPEKLAFVNDSIFQEGEEGREKVRERESKRERETHDIDTKYGEN